MNQLLQLICIKFEDHLKASRNENKFHIVDDIISIDKTEFNGISDLFDQIDVNQLKNDLLAHLTQQGYNIIKIDITLSINKTNDGKDYEIKMNELIFQ